MNDLTYQFSIFDFGSNLTPKTIVWFPSKSFDVANIENENNRSSLYENFYSLAFLPYVDNQKTEIFWHGHFRTSGPQTYVILDHDWPLMKCFHFFLTTSLEQHFGIQHGDLRGMPATKKNNFYALLSAVIFLLTTWIILIVVGCRKWTISYINGL